MAKLYFYYSAMNAGKSTVLLQSAYNYQERGMHVRMYTFKSDTRGGAGKVASRIGLTAGAQLFDDTLNFYHDIAEQHSQEQPLHCILVDEAQFLNKHQVQQLSRITIDFHVPVLCYGLRTDFLGEPFEGSQYLLALADVLNEIKTICHCGSKATMNLRVDASGNVTREGDQVQIGGNESYVAVCRKHFLMGDVGPGFKQLELTETAVEGE